MKRQQQADETSSTPSVLTGLSSGIGLLGALVAPIAWAVCVFPAALGALAFEYQPEFEQHLVLTYVFMGSYFYFLFLGWPVMFAGWLGLISGWYAHAVGRHTLSRRIVAVSLFVLYTPLLAVVVEIATVAFYIQFFGGVGTGPP